MKRAPRHDEPDDHVVHMLRGERWAQEGLQVEAFRVLPEPRIHKGRATDPDHDCSCMSSRSSITWPGVRVGTWLAEGGRFAVR